MEALQQQINELKDEIQRLKASSTIPYDVEQALRERLRINSFITNDSLPDGFEDAPLTAITAPSGGATVDSQARTAVNDIITALENLGLVQPN